MTAILLGLPTEPSKAIDLGEIVLPQRVDSSIFPSLGGSLVLSGTNGSFTAPGMPLISEPQDTAAVNVYPQEGLVTTEAGGTAQFTVSLTISPTSTVTIPIATSNIHEGVPSPDTLIFTETDYTDKAVTVSGIDEWIDDDNMGYTITVGPPNSLDLRYHGLNAINVSVTNVDNDTAGIQVSKTALSTNESGSSDSFSVNLTSEPTSGVTVVITGLDTTEGTITTGSLSFTTENWDDSQSVTVTGVDDSVMDGNVTYNLSLDAQSSDTKYDNLSPVVVSVTNHDNDTIAPAVIVNPTSGLTTNEDGSTTTFTLVLASKPMSYVTITLTSGDPSEGTVSPGSVTFTPTNWDTAKTITVTGVNDDVDDGNITYQVITSKTSSSDTGYKDLYVSDVTVTNNDDDTAGIIVDPIAITTTEAGGTGSFTIVLTSQPLVNVVIGISSDNEDEGIPDKSALTFTPSNWATPQTVTVTGQDDSIVDGPVAYTIFTAPASAVGDPKYNGVNATDVAAINQDNDVAGVNATPTSLTTEETGTTATFTVRLTSQPEEQVTVGVTSLDTTEGTVNKSALLFTSVNWDTQQSVTVTGVDDSAVDGNVTYNISLISNSTDSNYSLKTANVSATNIDNDTVNPAVIVSPTEGLITGEGGIQATFTVVLASKPMADVSIMLTSSDTSEGTVSPGSVTFTPLNWSTARAITITGVNDSMADGNIHYEIVTSNTSSDDADYNDLPVNNVSVTNLDDDTAGIVVTPTTITTTEAGDTAEITIRLQSQPTANVNISLQSSDTTEAVVSPTSLSFTPANWTTPLTAIVTGVDDAEEDGDIPYVIQIHAISTDTKYEFDPPDVNGTNLDDERRPLGNEDEYSLDEDTVLNVDDPGVLANDEGFGLDLTAELVDEPGSGEVILNTDGSFIYTPVQDFNGNDSFTYRASNGRVTSSATTVTLQVAPVNDAPIAYPDVFMGNANDWIVHAPGALENDIDVDEGDTLRSILVPGGDDPGSLNFSSDGSFTYKPEFSDGTVSFYYRAEDSAGVSSDPVTVTLLVDSIPPTIEWKVAPVNEGSVYYPDIGKDIFVLETNAEDDLVEPVLEVKYVYYLFWDAIKKEYVILGILSEAPYRLEVEIRQLNPWWNQISAMALDEAGNLSGLTSFWVYLPWTYLPMIMY